MINLGIDVGGSGIKGALVDITTGQLTAERHRIPTPIPATPEAIVNVINQIIKHFNFSGNLGIGFPAAVQNGIVQTASNIDKSWIGQNADELFTNTTGCKTTVINDADAAGYAAMNYGVGKGVNGVVIFITVGTGIGTAIYINGQLLPNTEFGHVYLKNGLKAEHYTSDAIRKRDDLSWGKWAKKFNKYLITMENLFYPDLFIIGGGISKKFDKFKHNLDTKTKIVAAQLQNYAGIIGAAVSAKPVKHLKDNLIIEQKCGTE